MGKKRQLLFQCFFDKVKGMEDKYDVLLSTNDLKLTFEDNTGSIFEKASTKWDALIQFGCGKKKADNQWFLFRHSLLTLFSHGFSWIWMCVRERCLRAVNTDTTFSYKEL